MATAILAEPAATPRILVIDPAPGDHLASILHRGGERVAVASRPGDLPEALTHHRPEVVFQYKMPGFRGATTAPMLATPGLRWLHYAGVGLDHLAPWDNARLMVSNSAGVLSDFMAEYVIGAILSANIGFGDYARRQVAHHWEATGWTGVKGKTLLIVGLGRIGMTVAERAKAFGMKTIGIRAHPTPAPHLDTVLATSELADIIGSVDFVSLHLPLTQETTWLFDAAMLERLKHGTILVNTARGGIVDEAALARLLARGHLRAAILDVFAQEPLPQDSPLWSVPNLTITPHMSDSVSDWKSRSAAFFLESLDAYLTDGRPPNLAPPERGY
ncbi:Phosphoglycerate dehydrogenase [Bosea sp. OK403]|uniref:D-2-hydroxyacid dehydrogenase n=1 Tax=Bosea sp. OK403 TaxID=1855286 RepID=UPI0008F319C2|nr:D-2-hydroxyacid dehydrogenase [Bosea sp. OK403]SFI04407.1 Phosphoglycerate dehydrogenase [Bosea sp. OK403]